MTAFGCVVVRDFDIAGITLLPAVTNAKLIVDANAVLPASQTRERFEPIPRQNREFAQLTHAIELCQCARDDVPKR